MYVCMYVCTYVWSGEASAVKRAPPVPIDPDELPAREKSPTDAGTVSRSWGGGWAPREGFRA